jgi:N4-gp56 family major capsid protein
MLYFARDAYGIVAFKGGNALTPMVVNPVASDSDPLAQRGHVGWKGYSATIILNDFWMARLGLPFPTCLNLNNRTSCPV